MINQKSKIKNQKRKLKFNSEKTFAFLIAILSFNFCLFNYFKQYAFAQTASSDNYSIEIENIDTSPNKTIVIPKSIDEQKATTPGKKIGIESIAITSPISFSVSADLIDFGVLLPGNPVTRSVTLSIISSSINSQILSFEDRPLTGPDNGIIADTTCDNGKCTEAAEAIWENNLTYGLGLRCEYSLGGSCIPFSNGAYFRQLADLSKNEQPQAIALARKRDVRQIAEVIFKLNAAGTQKPGAYSNSVTFIAVPNF